jgi:Zn finger protein HypA/HybF involved in hydrogenase expression
MAMGPEQQTIEDLHAELTKVRRHLRRALSERDEARRALAAAQGSNQAMLRAHAERERARRWCIDCGQEMFIGDPEPDECCCPNCGRREVL